MIDLTSAFREAISAGEHDHPIMTAPILTSPILTAPLMPHGDRRLNITGRGWSYFLSVNDLSTAECLDGEHAYRSCCADHACTCTEEMEDPEAEELESNELSDAS